VPDGASAFSQSGVVLEPVALHHAGGVPVDFDDEQLRGVYAVDHWAVRPLEGAKTDGSTSRR
jgi:hypothetical protein